MYAGYVVEAYYEEKPHKSRIVVKKEVYKLGERGKDSIWIFGVAAEKLPVIGRSFCRVLGGN